jgi:cyclic pyranopterin phosphate synthase
MLGCMADAGVYGFEAIDATLAFMPLAARRVLDGLGRKLSLQGWLSLAIEDRRRIVLAGAGETVDAAVAPVVDRAVPRAAALDVRAEPDARVPAAELVAALGAARPLDEAAWRGLSALDRYALDKSVRNDEKLARAFDEIVRAPRLTHLNGAGEARMVDVGAKAVSLRRAVAAACVRTTPSVVDAIGKGGVAKGDVIAVARVAGLLAAKRTPELIPLCHPVQTTRAALEFVPDPARGLLRVRTTVEAVDRTGVEMEAMVAVSVACLTVYDMIKSADRWATIDAVRLESKSGGKSGDVVRPAGAEGQ